MTGCKWWVATAAVAWSLASSAHADAIRVDRTAERMRVDGAIGEWKGARFVTLGQGDDAAVRYAFASVDAGLYVAAEVSDDKLVRQKGVGPKQDALVLTFAMPGSVATEVWLHAGETGRSKASAGIARGAQAPSNEPSVQVIEGPRSAGKGYVMEAYIPFALIKGSEIWEQGRAGLRFEDVDQGSKPDVTLSTAPGVASKDLPQLVLGTGQNDFLGSFLKAKGLEGATPRYDFRGNVAGDGEPERVVLIDKFAVVYGKHYKRGETYGYYALPFGTGGGLVSAELLDVDDDNLAELVVRVRQRNALGARELLVAVSLAETSIAPLFSIELKKESKGGFVESTLTLDKKSKPVRMRVQTGRAQGLDALTYQEEPARDAEPILLPWGDTSWRVYAYQSGKLQVLSEEKQAPEKPGPALADSTAVRDVAPAVPVVHAAVTPSALLDAFKRSQSIAPDAQPDRQLKANLVGGAGEEQVFAFGAKLVVLGPDIAQGGAFVGYGLPIANPQDLLYLGAADVTGDGARELLARVRQPLSGAAAAQVTRELLLVLRLEVAGNNARVARLLVAEVVRRQEKSAIINKLVTEGGKLRIEPGEAVGFTQASYPFANEATGGAERLLLPWADKPVRYRFDGTRLLAE